MQTNRFRYFAGFAFVRFSDYFYSRLNQISLQHFMKTKPEHNELLARMTFALIYPHNVKKVERKGRSKEELHQVIEWLTGFDDKKIQELIDENVTFESFFKHAKLNPNAKKITGLICGYRIEEIENPIPRQVVIS